MYHYFVG